MTKDTIVHIDLEADVELFLREVYLIGSEELLSLDAQRFFVGRAISHVANVDSVEHTVGRVTRAFRVSGTGRGATGFPPRACGRPSSKCRPYGH